MGPVANSATQPAASANPITRPPAGIALFRVSVRDILLNVSVFHYNTSQP